MNAMWTGDLNDDCTAHWRGLTLRAEKLGRKRWWWGMYADSGEVHSHDVGRRYRSGKLARAAAEGAAAAWLVAKRQP